MIYHLTAPGERFERDFHIVTPTGLYVDGTTDPTSPLLDVYYAGYDKAFVLKSEKEEISGFRECLALNAGPEGESLRSLFSPFMEIVALIAQPESHRRGEIVGGINFICFEFHIASGARIRSVALNYMHVLPQYRRRGWSQELLTAASFLATKVLDDFSPAARDAVDDPLIFIEQNDPLALTDEEYALDSAHAGIDQIDRLRVWAKSGAKIVDFDYVQPALSDDASEAADLVLSVFGTEQDRLDAEILRAHLLRFFSVSCLKGRPLDSDPQACAQIQHLDDLVAIGQEIALIDPLPWLVHAEASRATKSHWSLRDVLKT